MAQQGLHYCASRLARHRELQLPSRGLADWGRIAKLLLHSKAFIIGLMPSSCPKGTHTLDLNPGLTADNMHASCCIIAAPWDSAHQSLLGTLEAACLQLLPDALHIHQASSYSGLLTVGAWRGSIRGRSLRLQRRAERRGGGCEEDPVSEHVSEVSQLGCGACSSWATTAAYTGAEGEACKQAGSEPSRALQRRQAWTSQTRH